MGTEKNTWRFRGIPDIWVKIHNEIVVEMYTNSLGYIYGTKDIDNMIKAQLYMNRSEQHSTKSFERYTLKSLESLYWL